MTSTAPAVRKGDEMMTEGASSNSVVEIEQQRAIAETQAAMIIAKRFPRDQKACLDNIITACTRPKLAESAAYQYARGGTDIEGPTIRLAEAIAQNWKHMQFGIRELERQRDYSVAEAYAWDIENNVRCVKTFQVPHVRHTKTGSYLLKDPRDIYEMVANHGARRMRSCILAVIPGDITEEAFEQCQKTLLAKAEVTPERIAALVKKFGEYDVTKDQIETRIQRRLDAMTPALLINLGKIYNSLKDGMSAAADWFEIDPAKKAGDKTAESAAALRQRIEDAGEGKDTADEEKDAAVALIDKAQDKKITALVNEHEITDNALVDLIASVAGGVMKGVGDLTESEAGALITKILNDHMDK